MIWVWTASLLLAAILALSTYVQMLYLESLRLRTRDLPALQFFKSDIEERLGFKTEEGALRFSLVKHTALPFLGMASLAGGVLYAPLTLQSLGEALVFAWLLMMFSGYVIPQILYRRTAREVAGSFTAGVRVSRDPGRAGRRAAELPALAARNREPAE